MTEEAIRTPVLIAGGGPVGLVTALELGLRGIRCVVLNDKPETARHPKANAIGARSMEHFRRLGLSKPLRAAGLDDDHPTDVAYFTSLTGIELGRLRMPSRREALRQARDGDGAWDGPEPPHRCSQIFLERALFERARQLPAIELRFGWRLAGYEQDSNGVAATAEEVSTGRTLAIAADYLIGCDGGSSAVRKQTGIEYVGESGVVRPFMGGSMFAAYFRARRDPAWLDVRTAWQYWVLNHRYRGLLIHVDSDDLFLIHANIGEGEDAASMDPRRIVARAANAAVPLEPISSVPWTAGYSLVAERYRDRRVFLVGDSAHLFTPTGGLGMNTGVDDAANLGWKLAAVRAGWGGAALLDSYHDERHPIGERNVNFARGFATSVGTMPVSPGIEGDDEAARAERAALRPRLEDHAYREFIIPGIQLGLRYDASPVIAYDGASPPPDLPNTYAPSSCPGGRAPHRWLGDGAALFDRFGLGFTLLRLGARAPDGAALRTAAAERDVPLAVVDAPDDGSRDLYGRDLVLVRPDQHVAWRGNAVPDDPRALIDLVRGAA